MKKSFFEYLSMADSEKVHSQTIGWVFSNNCNAISKADKENVLKSLSNLNIDLNIEDVFVEIDDIDILIVGQNHLFVIENKIKISQHGNQLDKYEKYALEKAKELNIDQSHLYFIYLTIDGEDAKKFPWISISYSDLINQLKIINCLNNDDTVIFNQYLLTVSQILNVINSAVNVDDLRSWCFRNTGIKKSQFLSKQSHNKITQELGSIDSVNKAVYLIETGMIRFIQVIFYKRTLDFLNQKFLTDNFSNAEYGASQLSGEGLIQLNFRNLHYTANNNKFNIGYQIQNQTIKINIAHVDYVRSTKTQLPGNFIQMLQKIKFALKFNGRVTIGSSKAYGSVTKKLSYPLPDKMNPEQLATFIQRDIIDSKYEHLISEVLVKF